MTTTPNLPDGVVTFLFTDVEGSTRLWEEAPETMMEALQQHDDAIDQAVSNHAGVSVKPRGEGDSRFIVFESAHEAVAAAAAVQLRLATVDWATDRPLRVRASLHTGAADLQLGDYYGSAVNRAARLRGIAHGRQTVLSRTTWELVQDQLPQGVTIRDMGEHALKDLTRPEHVYQLDVNGLPDSFPPLKSLDATPNNLPQQLTDFVGRQTELAEATRLLGETRLLTILAPGGAGKTRLGMQAAADVTADYPDGVFVISLAEISSTEDIIQTIAESIGVAFSSDEALQKKPAVDLSGEQDPTPSFRQLRAPHRRRIDSHRDPQGSSKCDDDRHHPGQAQHHRGSGAHPRRFGDELGYSRRSSANKRSSSLSRCRQTIKTGLRS